MRGATRRWTGDRVFLIGSGADPDSGETLTYSWTQVGTPAVTLSNAASATAYFTAPTTSATLVFRLTVSDGSLSGADDVTITVQAPATPFLSSIVCEGRGITFNSATSTLGIFLNLAVDFNLDDGAGSITTETRTSVAASDADHTRTIYADLEPERDDTRLTFWMRVPVPDSLDSHISGSNQPDEFTIEVFSSKSAWDSDLAPLASVTGSDVREWDDSLSSYPDHLEMELRTVTSVVSEAPGVQAIVRHFYQDRDTSFNYFYLVTLTWDDPSGPLPE